MKKGLLPIIIGLAGLMLPLHAQQNSPIIPKPQSIEWSQGVFRYVPVYKVYVKGIDKQLADYALKRMSETFVGNIPISFVAQEKEANIAIRCSRKSTIDEKYKLIVTPIQISVDSDNESGAFYGIQSLLVLLRDGNATSSIPCQTIEDAPRFSWRAFMLDEARYFKGEKEVLRLLDVMAELKMNVFHWHLTDDQGWRVESKKYPKLTQVGSKRSDTQIGGWNSKQRSGVPHEGFYTQKQIKSIIAYAKARHIKVIPEIEMPGHASAAIASYPWLGTKKEQIEVPVTFGKHYAVYNVIDPKVKKFLYDIVDEMTDLFETDVIHIGGDEVRFNQWEEDPAMQVYKSTKGFNSFMDIQIEFTNQMSQHLAKRKVDMMGWNEILGKQLHNDDNISFSEPTQKIAQNVIVQFWKGDLKEMEKAAKEGFRLVNSYHSYTYIDYGYNVIPLEKAYRFDPIPKGLPKEFEKNIIGSGCQMWSEWIPSVKEMNQKIYPNIAAYAEVGWSTPEKDFEDFLSRLRKHLIVWKEKGIEWYPSPELDLN